MVVGFRRCRCRCRRCRRSNLLKWETVVYWGFVERLPPGHCGEDFRVNAAIMSSIMGGSSKVGGRSQRTVDIADDSAVGRTLRQILEQAVEAGASDVHLEPRSGYGVVRVRIGSYLQTTTKLPSKGLAELTAEFKKLAELDASEQCAPQFGKCKLNLGRRSLELQVASVPALDGERLTLHFVDETASFPTLEQLGYWGSTLANINRALTQPHGLIVVAGSDRTSTALTLASMLSRLHSPILSVAIVGQDVNYHLPGVIELPARPEIGLTAGRQIRAAVRRGAHVIAVTDVHDPAAARAAVELAERQLVLAGLHGQDAAEALLGLAHLSKESLLLAQTLKLAIGQRLVDRLCPDCRETYKPDDELQQKLARNFDLPHLHELEEQALREGLGKHAEQFSANRPSSSNTHIIHLWRAKKNGCAACSHTGYQNRITVNEAITPHAKLQAILARPFAAAEIRKAVGSDAISLAEDAAVKALRGLVPIEAATAFIKN